MNTSALLLCAALLLGTAAQAQIQLPPAGLLPGQQYRILFVTTTVRAAQTTNIADYNTFVAANANASPALAALGTQWYALASTTAVSARANTMTDPTPAGPTGVPIYRPDGVRLADNYDGLWGGGLQQAPNRTSLGTVTSAARVWTGNMADGVTNGGAALGESFGRCGIPMVNYSYWAEASSYPNNQQLPLYGISDVLTVPLTIPTIDDLGVGCPGSRAIRFVPNANGGYTVVNGGRYAYDPDLGAPAGVTADDTITATGLDLGFAFPFPSATGVAPEQFVRIDPNGRILPDSSGQTAGAWDPTLATFVWAGYPMVCPFWTNIDVTAPGSDSVYFKTSPGAATFTWYRVAQWSPAPASTPPLTVQCTLFANGEVLVVFEDVEHFDTSGTNGCLVGISTGGGGPLGTAVDLSLVDGGAAPSGNPVFEYFTAAQFDLFRPTGGTPVLSEVTLPALGSNFVYEIDNAPAAANFALYLIGFELLPTALPLSAVGFATPCSLMVSFVDIQVAVASGTPGVMGSGQIAIPAAPASLLGLDLYLQGATDGAPFTTPLLTTNTLRATVGQ